MDETVQLAIELSEENWCNFKNDIDGLTTDELRWRALPHGNSINALIRHVRGVEELFLSRLEQGEQSPY